MNRSLLVLTCVLSAAQAAAFQCKPISQSMDAAPIVFIGQPTEVVQRDALVEKEPIMMGTPSGYDLIRFSVIEQLKGDAPATIDLLCPVKDMRCQVGKERNPLIIALSTPLIAKVPQHLFCNMDYLTPPPGWSTYDAEVVRGMLDKFRAARQAKKGSR